MKTKINPQAKCFKFTLVRRGLSLLASVSVLASSLFVNLIPALAVTNSLTDDIDMNGKKVTDVGTPSANTDAATKKYVDDLIDGLSWKDPVDDSDGPSGAVPDVLGTYNCNATNESWATYNSAEGLIYVCSDVNGDGSAYEWVNIGTTAVIPDLAGEVTGDMTNNVIADNKVDSANIINETILSEDINDDTIVNADINSAAAIAGTKISPDFGSQDVAATGDLAINTNTLFVNSSAGKVGIGTASPAHALHVKTASGNAEIDIQSGSDDYWGIYQDETSKDLNFWNTNSDNLLTLTDEGNVGIGTVSPAAKLDVVGTLRIGDDGVSCDSANEGAFRYRSGSGNPEYCDGVAWQVLATGGLGAILSINPSSVVEDISGSCGQTSCPGTTHSMVVKNIGQVSSDPLTYTLTRDVTRFTVTDDTCTGTILAPNEQCQIDIQPTAIANESYEGILEIPHHNMPQALLLTTGTGFGCLAGQNAYGGIVLACGLNDGAYDMISMPSGCDGTTTNPTCSGTDDTVKKTWGPTDHFSGLPNTDGNGPQNTANLSSARSITGPFSAAEYCADMVYGGYDDWYLPASYEFRDVVWPNRALAPLKSGQRYWTSTEYSSASNSTYINESNGSLSLTYKNREYYLRCVRREGEAYPAPQTSDLPDDFTLNEISVSPGSRSESNIVTINGLIGTSATVSISGDGSPTFKINGGSEVTSGSVDNGDTIQVLADADLVPGSVRMITLTVGTGTEYWRIFSNGECGGGSCTGVDKRIFATSTTIQGDFGSVSAADTICQTDADAAALGGTWKALISGGNIGESAVLRMDYNWDRLVNINGDVIATDPIDLWDGSIDNAVGYDENGSVNSNTIWSGTQSNGLYEEGNSNCNGWTSTDSGTTFYHSYGQAGSSGTNWIESASHSAGCNDYNSLYCVESDSTESSFSISPSSGTNMDVVSPSTSGTAVTFTITNIGNVTSGTLAATTTSSVNFEILPGTDNCTGSTLSPGSSCTLDIRPRATSNGNYAASLRINDPLYSITETVGISGTSSGFGTSYIQLWSTAPQPTDIYYNGGEVGIGTDVISGALKLDVEGKIGAQEYCDETGNSCVAGNVLGASSSWAKTGNDISYTDGNVGIGTTSPAHALHVKTASGNAEIDIQSGSDDYWGIYQDETSKDLNFWNTNSDNLLTLTDEGNVGIGTVSPGAALDVASAENTESIRISDTTNADSIGVYTGSGSPEGTVTAQLGSIYSDHASGTIYKKSSGDDTNTGWEEIGTGSGGTGGSKTYAKAQLASDQSIYNNITLALDSVFAGNSSLLSGNQFVAPRDGIYNIGYQISFLGGSADYGSTYEMGVSTRVNGVIINHHKEGLQHGNGWNGMTTQGVIPNVTLQEGDTVDFFIYQWDQSKTRYIASDPKKTWAYIESADSGGGTSTADMAKMRRNAVQSIPNDTPTLIDFDTIVYDTGNIADATTNNRFNIAKDGKYLVEASVGFANAIDDNEYVSVQIIKNGNAISEDLSFSGLGNWWILADTSEVLDLQAGDYLEMKVKQTEGSTLNTTVGIEAYVPQMSVTQLDSGDSVWETSGSDASYSAGNVGIGTISPTKKLDIAGNGINIENTTFAAQNGIIYKDGTPFIHNFNYGNNGTVTTDGRNTFIGKNAGNFTMGSTATQTYHASYNTAIGENTLVSNTEGYYNTASGSGALTYNTTGTRNTASGVNAGRYLADGITERTTGDNGLYLGVDSKASADGTDNEVVIGYNAVGAGSNSVVLGSDSVTKTLLKGNVGIGMTSPGAKLSIADSGTASGAKFLQIGDDSFLTDIDVANMVGIYGNPNSDRAGIRLGSDGSYIFGDNGNVGIGMTAPTSPLQFATNTGEKVALYNSGSSFYGFGVEPNTLVFQASGGDYDGLNNADMVINGAGNVGIGTTSPSEKLDVTGNIKATQFCDSTGYCVSKLPRVLTNINAATLSSFQPLCDLTAFSSGAGGSGADFLYCNNACNGYCESLGWQSGTLVGLLYPLANCGCF